MTETQYRILFGLSSFCLAAVVATILLISINQGVRKQIASQQQNIQQAQVIQQTARIFLRDVVSAAAEEPQFISMLNRYGFNVTNNNAAAATTNPQPAPVAPAPNPGVQP
ncbi:MAG: hypothetical protein AAFY98_02480 [Verrucomicrobiota bacterium]